MVFASTSTDDNVAYYAYHTYPSLPHYNPSLRWQDTRQWDLGIEFNIKGTRVSLSAFHHKTHGTYMSEKTYTPFSYRYTSPSAAQQSRIPAADRAFRAAKDNDKKLYSDLAQLIVRSNYPYTMNPNRLSAYYSANFSVTKEIGDHISISFYANNFFNNMRRVHSSQTDLYTSLFGSSYIPTYYYGLSLRLKI